MDRQVVNLTRFPLFFPEQRPFFTEGASIFAYGRQQQTMMFYSRRVGLGAGGTPVEVPFGARVQGRIGRSQVGFRAARPGAFAGGVDFEFPFILRERDNLLFLGNAAWSRDSVGAVAGAHYRFVVDYPNDHADLVTRFDRVEAGYDPALGFVSQNGIYRWGGSMAVTPRPERASIVRRRCAVPAR